MFRFYKMASWPGGTYIDVGELCTNKRVNELLEGHPLERDVRYGHALATTSEYLIYEG